MQKEPPPFVWAAPDEKNILNCKSKYSLASLALNILLTWHLTYIGNYIIVCIFLFPHTSHVSQCGFFFHDTYISLFFPSLSPGTVIQRGPPDSPYAGGEYYGVILFPSEYPFKPPGIKMLTPSGRFIPDKKICFSMSDFHPGSWNPAWSVATMWVLLCLLRVSASLYPLADEYTLTTNIATV